MSVIASCTHELTKAEGFGIDCSVKSYCAESNVRAVSYMGLCVKCYKRYIRDDLILLTKEAEEMWIAQNKTDVLSCFPATGKTYFYNNSNEKVFDSDSSKFDKSNFPANYIEHIKDLFDGLTDLVLVSSHAEVRKALRDNGIDHRYVIPNINLKEEYIERMKNRGNDERFVELISSNWENWINEIIEESNGEHIELKSGQYLSDVI